MNTRSEHPASNPSNQAPLTTTERLASLRAQRQQLESEISEVSRIVELEATRNELAIAAAIGSQAQKDVGRPSNPAPAS